MKLQHFLKTYRNFTFPTWTFPLFLVLIALMVYGILLPSLGFYWDDWAKISVSKIFGLDGYWNYYAEDRPLSAWTHIFFTPFLGTGPLAWQVFQFGLELLCAWGVFWTVISLWPGKRWQAISTALLFLVYPAFTQHATAVTFHQQWLQYGLYFLSLGVMIHAIRIRQNSALHYWLWTALSLVLSMIQLTVTEYFVPLELLRPLLIWLTVSWQETWHKRFLLAVRISLPYLVLLGAYGIWRLFLIDLSGEDPYQLETLYSLLREPMTTLHTLSLVAFRDSFHILLSAWQPIIHFVEDTDFTRFEKISIGLSLAAGCLIVFYLLRSSQNTLQQKPERRWQLEALGVGLAAFVLGVLPAWITGREVLYDFHSDRYALPALFGASLIWVVVVDWVSTKKLQQAVFMAVLVAGGSLIQLNTANDYRWLWESEKRFFWQLYWRAPAIEPGTAILTYDEPFANQGLFSLSSALNVLYPQSAEREGLSYWWYDLSRYENVEMKDPIQLHFQTQFRSLVFSTDTPNTLILQYETGHCLRVVTSEDQQESDLQDLTDSMRNISNLDLISAEAQDGWVPPEEIFGVQPDDNWCYFFEKADLARQFEQWDQIAVLGDAAQAAGYSPLDSESNSAYEWLPFIEGYARSGNWDEARELTLEAQQLGEEYKASLSNLWDELAKDATENDVAGVIRVVQSTLKN